MTERPIVLDFGMHKGEDTAFYLALGARVIAFEANGELVAHNRARFPAELATGQLEIVEGAIVPPGSTAPTVTFFIDSQKSVWGTTSQDWAERNQGLGSTVREVTVPAIDLAKLLADNPDLLYAKIDIEGADQFVLATLASTGIVPDYVSIESDKVSLDHVVAEIETLQALGYRKFAAVQQATVPRRRFRATGATGAPVDLRFEGHASGPFGPWLDQPFKRAEEVIEDYRRIFARYRRFGDESWLMSNALTRLPTRIVNQLAVRTIGAPLCGWYDTHASK